MDNEIFRIRRAAWFGRKPVGVAAFREWMAQIEKRVERLEKAAGERKQLKLESKK